MIRIPTDRKILQAIYDRHADSLENFDRNMADRDSKIMVPIDCEEIGRGLKVNSDIVFGRLYFHLEQKHGYDRDNGARVAFFARVAGKDRNCVNLPLLASVLAGLQEEWARHMWALGMSIASLVLSIVAIGVSVAKH
jgi:hypothetical protein